MCEKFDWENFYSEHNREIIEQLLDGEKTTIGTLIEIFFEGIEVFSSEQLSFHPSLLTTPRNIYNCFKVSVKFFL